MGSSTRSRCSANGSSSPDSSLPASTPLIAYGSWAVPKRVGFPAWSAILLGDLDAVAFLDSVVGGVLVGDFEDVLRGAAERLVVVDCGVVDRRDLAVGIYKDDVDGEGHVSHDVPLSPLRVVDEQHSFVLAERGGVAEASVAE